MNRVIAVLAVIVMVGTHSHAQIAVPAESFSPKQSAAKSSQPRKWPHDGSDLQPDPAVHWGNLQNGLRYAILPHGQDPHRASLRLLIDVGSLYEEDSERGLAHFLEHMAFNGTKHFPPQQTLEYFQRLGMGFGAHTNAATSFDYTVYQLELPSVNPEYVNDALRLFRDFLDGMTIDRGEVEQERGVILSEMRDSNTAAFRASVAGLEFVAPTLRLSKRMPIGIANTVKSITPEQFNSFYRKWYTPGRTTIVAVGDFDPAMMQDLVRRNFDSARAMQGEHPDPDFGKLQEATNPRASFFHDPELSDTTISLNIERPAAKRRDSVAYQRVQLVRYLLQIMLDTRFQAISVKPGSPIHSAGASCNEVVGLIEETNAYAVTDAEHWPAALSILEQEIRRATRFGFTELELSQAVAAITSGLAHSATQADTRASKDIAESIVRNLCQDNVVTHPTYDQTLYAGLLRHISAADCQSALAQLWASDDVCIYLKGNMQLSSGDAEKLILEEYFKSRRQEVGPQVENNHNSFAYTDFGAPGKIVNRDDQPDLAVTQVTFANNVRVNFKKTDFQKKTVHFSVRVGGGRLDVPKGDAGLSTLAEATLIAGGVKAHDLAELNRLLADKQWSLSFNVRDDAFQFLGQSSTADLETTLQAAAAYLLEPAFRPEALEQVRSQFDGLYAQLEHTPEGILSREVDCFLRSGDPRFGIPARDVLEQYSSDQVRNWLCPIFQSSYLELGIVGDIETDQVLHLVAKTFGALPKRERAKQEFAEERVISFPADSKKREFRFDSDSQRAASLVIWPMPDSSDIRECRRLRILSQILSDRLRVKVREELGATYTPQVLLDNSEVFPSYGTLTSLLLVDPSEVDRVANLVRKIGNAMSAGEISDDEFQRALAPEVSSITETSRDNAYWLGVVQSCQERPELLEWARSRIHDYPSITRAEVVALAKKYLAADRAVGIGLLPNASPTLADR